MKREVVLVIALVLLCTIIFSFSVYSVAASECNDHVDNNENGYCDAPVQGAYCEDGSIVGDPACTSITASESACQPSQEVCDGIDNDCNGQIDDGLVQTIECGSNIGECSYGVQSRECRDGVYSGWSACTGGTDPARETCDGLDNDCNNVVDDYCPTSQVVVTTNSNQTNQNHVTSNTSSSSSNEQDNLTNNQDRTEVEITEKIAEKDNFTIIIFIIVGILVLIYIIVEIIFAFQRKKV